MIGRPFVIRTSCTASHAAAQPSQGKERQGSEARQADELHSCSIDWDWVLENVPIAVPASRAVRCPGRSRQ